MNSNISQNDLYTIQQIINEGNNNNGVKENVKVNNFKSNDNSFYDIRNNDGQLNNIFPKNNNTLSMNNQIDIQNSFKHNNTPNINSMDPYNNMNANMNANMNNLTYEQGMATKESFSTNEINNSIVNNSETNLKNENNNDNDNKYSETQTPMKIVTLGLIIIFGFATALSWNEVAKYYIAKEIKFNRGSPKYYIYYASCITLILIVIYILNIFV